MDVTVVDAHDPQNVLVETRSGRRVVVAAEDLVQPPIPEPAPVEDPGG